MDCLPTSETTGHILLKNSDQPKADRHYESESEPGQEENIDIETVFVNRITSDSMFRIPVLVQGFQLNAVVDTAAEVTLLSDEVYAKLLDKPKRIKDINLRTAGKQLTMKGFVAGPFNITIKDNSYKENVYIFPINDHMLLGLDFLRKAGALINLPQKHLRLGSVIIDEIEAEEQVCISAVTVEKTTAVPPNCFMKVKCNVSTQESAYCLESSDDKFRIVSTLHEKCSQPVVCLLNLSDTHMKLKTGQQVAVAQKAAVVQPVPTDLNEQLYVCQVASDVGGSQTDNSLPAHLNDLFERSIVHLDVDQQQSLRQLLIEYQDVFAKDEFDLGNFTAVEHRIDTSDARPIKQRMRRTPMGFAAEEEAHLQKMLKAGVIKPSCSEWASAPVLVRKKDGGVRWCVDYRALNAVTVKDVYPLPLIEDCMDMLAGHKWFSKLDANSAYWQIRVKPEDRKKTAVITKYGLYEFVRMAFGLCNAPATYARAMNLVLHGLNWNTVLSFLDDLMALGKDFSHHLRNLRDVFERFRTYQLKFKPKKCELFKPKVEFLGRLVGPEGIEIGKADIEAVLNWPRPTCTREVESFLGLANYHRAFIENYALRACPLYDITGKKPFVWGESQEQSFVDIKDALTSPPILGLPNSKDSFILDTDASELAVGGVLYQVQGGTERVISYGSYALSPQQRRYCTTRKELLAVVRFTRQFRHYLLGKPFKVRTDHSSLTWLLRFKEPQGQLARWLEELSLYDMTVLHRPGKDHGNADALSRFVSQSTPCANYRANIKLEDLPCGGCKYCAKAYRDWRGFEEDVDDIVPLGRKVCSVEVSPDDLRLFQDVDFDAVQNIESLSGQASLVLNNEVRASDIVAGDEKKDARVWDLQTRRVQEAQGRDTDLELLAVWLGTKAEPTEGELFISSPTAKFYWVNRDSFCLKNGLVWMLDSKTGNHRLVIPEELREEVLFLCHSIPASGHQGEDRTLERTKRKYFWHGVTKDVKSYVAACSACNKWKKPVRKAKWEMTKYHAGAPLERVHLDFLGPLPKTSRGNEYVLMVVDQFTKWVECFPLPSQTAEQTAQAVVDGFFSRFGCPFQIFTDRGSNFESKLFSAVCELLQIHKSRTTAYRASANGQVERYNRTLMDAVRCFVGRNQGSWDRLLPQIAGALRASVNRHTGYTPNKLMLGREVNMPADLVFPSAAEEIVETDDYVARLEKSMKSAHETARRTLKSNVSIMKRNYDVKLHMRQFEIGDAVYILNAVTTKGQSRKLGPPWKGPAVVEARISPYLYRIRLQRGSVTTNHDRMKLCKITHLPAWVKKVQRQVKSSEHSDQDNTATDLYCVCNGPDTGQFMVQCDHCDDWFHGECVNVTEKDVEGTSEYICPKCIQG